MSMVLLGRVVRGVLLAIGISVFAVGLLVAFVPGTDGYLPMGTLIETLGSDYIVVAILGIAALGFALVTVLFRRLTGVNEAATPIVEGVQSAPSPGASFDRSNGRLFGVWISTATRNRLREAAILTLMRSENCSRSTAERRVEEGSWTDNTTALRLLGGTDSGGTFSLGNQIERTIGAIEALAPGETRTTTAVGNNEKEPFRHDRAISKDTAGSGIDTDDGRTNRRAGTAPARRN